MLFCNFYKSLREAMGKTEFSKLPPDKGNPHQKIFMLMTLSCNDKRRGYYFLDQLKDLNEIFKDLKKDLEKLRDNIQELKKEATSFVKGEEEPVSLIDHRYRIKNLINRINFYCFIKDKNILHPEISADSFIKYNDILKGLPKKIIENFIKCIPFERLNDKLIRSFKEILNKNLSKTDLDIYKKCRGKYTNPRMAILKESLNKDNFRDIVKACINEDIDILKHRFYKVCVEDNPTEFKRLLRDNKEPFIDRFRSYKDKDTIKTSFMADFIKNVKKGQFDKITIDDCKSIVDIFGDILINSLIEILTDNIYDCLYKNRTVMYIILSTIPKDRCIAAIDHKDIDGSIDIFIDKFTDSYIDAISKDINAIDFSEFDKFVAKNAVPSKKFEDIFNENDIQIIHRYIKYLGFSLKNVFPDYSNVSDWQIKEYINYLCFWHNKKDKDQTFKDYCLGKTNISNFANEITPYLASRPYFIDVINNLPDEQKRKIYEEFKAEIGSLKITPYLANSPYFIDDINNLPDEQKGKIYEKLKAGIGALEITSNLTNLPYFIGDINNLPDKQKGKIYEELNAEIGSLDFLGEKLATLLKMIIDEATNKDLKIFEELWEKEEDNLLEMVLYPILHELFGSNSATYVPRYSLSLKIRNENNAVIIEKHPDTFLDNLFFFIAKKKNIFFNHFKLMDIHYSRVHIGGVIRKWTTDDEIYGNKNNKNNKNNKTGLLLSLKYGSLYYDLINFLPGVKFFSTSIEYLDTLNFPPKVKKVFTRITYTYRDEERSFKDIKHILEFKKNLKNSIIYDYDDSFVLIELNPFFDYFKKNKKEIDKNLVCTNIEKTREQKNFWEDKCKSELYKYIHEKLNTEEAQSHIQTPFQRLKDYYLQGVCPADPGSLSDILDLYEPYPEA